MDFKDLFKLSLIVSVMLLQQGCADDDDSRTSKVVLGISDVITAINDLQYQYSIVVQVAELDGAPIPNATVSLKLKATGYYKGDYIRFDTSVPPDGFANVWGQVTTATCVAEDTNNNGVLDAGEDINFNGLIDPKIPSITLHPTEVPTLISGTQRLITDDNGFGYFTITYPKSMGSWVDVELTASISGGLPENQDSQAFTLSVSKPETEQVDIDHPFLTSPYGTVGDCASRF